VEFIDLATQQKKIKEKLDANIQAVLSHGKYIMGPEIKELETRLAEYTGVKYGIACSSGTDALLLALMAFGVGRGDAVLTTPFTFIATAEVISLLGAMPVFVDVDPQTFNIDPEHLERTIKAFQNESNSHPLPRNRGQMNLKGIIGVDLFGLPADYDPICKIAKENGLFIIEDAAQSFGGQYKDKMACSLGDIGCTSFFPAKPLGGYGDGGMCFTENENLEKAMRSILVHGKGSDKYENVRIGINGRLDTLQAAILHAKFDIFKDEIENRQRVAKTYKDLLSKQTSGIVTPHIPLGYRSAWAQYSILAKDETHRSSLQSKMKDAGIPTAVYYPKPLHLQTAFKDLGYKKGDFPVSEDSSTRIFSLPMHPYLAAEEQIKIAGVIENP
jgi:dTDP-4-amino-4,6-dideoxygalactose transaminase